MRNPSMASKVTCSSSSPASGSTTSKITPCCSKEGLKRGPWTPEEDEVLSDYIRREGEGRWRTLPKRAGLLRCGKSCRLRWMNYLRPSLKRGQIAPDEEDLILRLHRLLGNRWALIAGRIPGRTDNDIKNYWNTHLSKKLISQGIDPRTHKPLTPESSSCFRPLAPEPNLNNNNTTNHQRNSPSMDEVSCGGNEDSIKNNTNDHLEGIIDHHQHNNWQNYNALLALQRTTNEENDEHIGYSTGEDVFSSLLNSWVYDEVFGYSIYGGSINFSQSGFDDECKRFSDHVNKCF
ncbi:hypothetical protein AQUCO_00900496v1 [Aquilegia coerulea]|uniref:Uncharacterized protein n=1 Tax=Aquilegia coerulea TaxID=218851 RepID=A0A2G5EDW2_AQUCA|nr:hypothetical protein AQUCO_00900496v1 [Aquilegia coerulea]